MRSKEEKSKVVVEVNRKLSFDLGLFKALIFWFSPFVVAVVGSFLLDDGVWRYLCFVIVGVQSFIMVFSGLLKKWLSGKGIYI